MEQELMESKNYEAHLMQALGTDSIEEAMGIAKAAGIRPSDVPSMLMASGQNVSNLDPKPLPEDT